MTEGGRVVFTCRVKGLLGPGPTFTWHVNGLQQRSGVTNTVLSSADGTISHESAFTIDSASDDSNGFITCVVLQERDLDTYSVTSTANLIVFRKFCVLLVFIHM